LGSNSFADSILILADAQIDFAEYDKDGDAKVDGLFFMIIHSSDPGGCNGLGVHYQTNDTLANGDTVSVVGQYGVEVRIQLWGVFSPIHRVMHTAAHEWGHQFGLEDFHCCCC
jgi:M6 family metalloprotease-like protein